jgi:hypothetical protein
MSGDPGTDQELMKGPPSQFAVDSWRRLARMEGRYHHFVAGVNNSAPQFATASTQFWRSEHTVWPVPRIIRKSLSVKRLRTSPRNRFDSFT